MNEVMIHNLVPAECPCSTHRENYERSKNKPSALNAPHLKAELWRHVNATQTHFNAVVNPFLVLETGFSERTNHSSTQGYTFREAHGVRPSAVDDARRLRQDVRGP